MPLRAATIRGMLVGIIRCALLLALGRMPGMEWLTALLLFTVGPMIGAIAHRGMGGRGILGGVMGGVVSYIGFGVVMYLRASLYPQPDTVDYLGPGLSFLLLASYGGLIGLAVGILLWGAMSVQRPRGKS